MQVCLISYTRGNNPKLVCYEGEKMSGLPNVFHIFVNLCHSYGQGIIIDMSERLKSGDCSYKNVPDRHAGKINSKFDGVLSQNGNNKAALQVLIYSCALLVINIELGKL